LAQDDRTGESVGENAVLVLKARNRYSGREIEGPMAIVILGGLITSTALNLLVLPSLALRYGRFEKAEA
jgi:Cu/Ag efflux pump CusA